MDYRHEPLRQNSRSRWENPRDCYEAPEVLGRPSRLDRGSSTTKICQAVLTRESQTDSPSFIAVAVLFQRLARSPPETDQHEKIVDTIDRSQHISSYTEIFTVSGGMKTGYAMRPPTGSRSGLRIRLCDSALALLLGNRTRPGPQRIHGTHQSRRCQQTRDHE